VRTKDDFVLGEWNLVAFFISWHVIINCRNDALDVEGRARLPNQGLVSPNVVSGPLYESPTIRSELATAHVHRLRVSRQVDAGQP
jgi:hypothetical protein